VTSIGYQAFYNNQLTQVTFLGDRPALTTNSFSSNPALSTMAYCNGQAGWPGESIYNGSTYIAPISVICNADSDYEFFWCPGDPLLPYIGTMLTIKSN